MLDFVPPPHPDPTPDDTTIWRYMDLPRFISLLATKELWFAKAASFRDDPFEGFCVAAHQPIRPDLDKNNGPITISVDEMLGLVSRDSALVCENAGGHLYVNSWCLGPTESMAMWQ